MTTIIEALRSIVGEPDFYHVLYGNNPTWDYAAMIEYFCAVVILVVVITSIFKILARRFR